LKADEGLKAHALQRIAKAASNLSVDVAKKNKLLVLQLECTADQIAIILFKEAQNIDPTLAKTYFRLEMEEEVTRVRRRIALESIQLERAKQPTTTLQPTNSPQLHPLTIDLEATLENEEEEEGTEDALKNHHYKCHHKGSEAEGVGRDVDFDM